MFFYKAELIHLPEILRKGDFKIPKKHRHFNNLCLEYYFAKVSQESTF